MSGGCDNLVKLWRFEVRLLRLLQIYGQLIDYDRLLHSKSHNPLLIESSFLRGGRGPLGGGGEARGALGLGQGRRLGARRRRQQERHRILLPGQ